jgi:hypothetical protein
LERRGVEEVLIELSLLQLLTRVKMESLNLNCSGLLIP